ncbi:MAG: aminotransferase class IV family protein [Anaerolineales bacterium]|nr:aminotransferase class IV family protein [Anaerolineales bacterium]
MTVTVYAATAANLERTPLTGPSLDAVSLQLPAGVYTTARTYAGRRIVGLSAHLNRLADSHTRLGRRSGPPLDLAGLRAILRAVLEQAAQPEVRLRLTVPFEGERVYISVEPFEAFPAACYTQGVACATTRLERENPLAKSTAFIAAASAARAGAAVHELLRVDAAGRLLEGVSSNFFVVLEGVLRTAGAGVLEGVTRQVVLAQAAGLITVALEPVRVADLAGAAEAFITSASREVMPIVRIDEHVIGAGRPGPVTLELLARYRAHLLETSEVP